MDSFALIDKYHVTRFAYFIDKHAYVAAAQKTTGRHFWRPVVFLNCPND
jgi:hypothetical protein